MCITQQNSIQEMEMYYKINATTGAEEYYADVAALTTAYTNGLLNGSTVYKRVPTDRQMYILKTGAKAGHLIFFFYDTATNTGKFIEAGTPITLNWA